MLTLGEPNAVDEGRTWVDVGAKLIVEEGAQSRESEGGGAPGNSEIPFPDPPKYSAA